MREQLFQNGIGERFLVEELLEPVQAVVTAGMFLQGLAHGLALPRSHTTGMIADSRGQARQTSTIAVTHRRSAAPRVHCSWRQPAPAPEDDVRIALARETAGRPARYGFRRVRNVR